MKQLQVDLGSRSYPIYIGKNLLKDNLFEQHIKSKQVVIVTNTTIEPLYLDLVKQQLSAYQVETIVLPDGEKYKNLAYIETIFTFLLEKKFSRNATLCALGGGVIGDMAGFVAACYQRGIAFIQIPTTLLAQVDSSVGGKTGVNHILGKNMIGAFHQPQAVIIDTQVLTSLDDRQLAAGIAEVIKYGLIRDIEFFIWLENNIEKLLSRDPDALAFAIERSCINKAEIVSQDETETGIRAILNFGHTFGHAIETGMGYGKYLHGEAIAIGMCQAALLSQELGYLTVADVLRIKNIFEKTGLSITAPKDMSAQTYVELMSVDKKNINGDIRVICLHAIGTACLPMAVETSLLMQILNSYNAN